MQLGLRKGHIARHPRVVATLRDSIKQIRKEDARKGKQEFPRLGMLADLKVARDGKTTKLCFSTDDVGPFLSTINSLGDRTYVSDVRAPINAAEGHESDCANALAEQK